MKSVLRLMLRRKEGCDVVHWRCFFGRMLLRLFRALIRETYRTAVICNEVNSVLTGTEQGLGG